MRYSSRTFIRQHSTNTIVIVDVCIKTFVDEDKGSIFEYFINLKIVNSRFPPKNLEVLKSEKLEDGGVAVAAVESDSGLTVTVAVGF